MTLPTPNLPMIQRDSSLDLGECLAQLLANLGAVQWRGEPAFGRVELFSAAEIEEAFRQLLVASSRAALVIWSGDQFTDRVQGAELRGACETELTLVIVSSIIGAHQVALVGNDQNPGLFTLRSLVMPAVTGVLLPGRAYLRRANGEPMVLQLSGKGARTRVAYALTLSLSGGEIYAPLGSRPIL